MTGPNKRLGETGENTRPMEFFTPERKEMFLKQVSLCGQIVASCRAIGVAPATVKNHRAADNVFDQRVKDAVDLYRDWIDAEIRRRGFEGVEKPVFYQGQVVGWIKEFSDQLALAHAKAHDPRYRERSQLDVKHSGGVMVVPAAPASTEDWSKRFSTAAN